MIRFNLFVCFFLVSLGLYGQPKKLVEVVVVGTGVTTDAALQNAFKKAIEQSFGTFVSTKTEILNDEITKNELVSVSNGNIQNYEVLSTAKLNDREFSTTVKVSVSISNLVSFVKSKGISAEIKGSILSANILQQEFNEANEIKATTELTKTLAGILNKSFDYSVKLDEPTNGGENLWNVPLTVNVQPNENIKLFKKFLLQSMAGLSMTPAEAANYIKLNKPVYKIAIGDEPYFEGNGVSRELFVVSNKSTLTKNNVPKIEINKSELKKLTDLKDKNFYICYSVRGNYEGAGLDTLFVTSNNLEADINKIKDQLNAEAEIKLKGGNNWYYTPEMMSFSPIIYWTSPGFVPPVYYFRKLESAQLFYTLVESDLKDILFDITIKNEIKKIAGTELLKKFQDVKSSRSIRFLENDFKLYFGNMYHETNQIYLPVRSNYFTNPYDLSDRYSSNTTIDLEEYWNFNNTHYNLIKANSNLGSSNNAILRSKFETISYPLIDFMKFASFVNPGTKTIGSARNRSFREKLTSDPYLLVMTLDSFKEQQPLFSYKFIDKVTKDDLSKISSYSIEHNYEKAGGF
jgi:hypothetical protein